MMRVLMVAAAGLMLAGAAMAQTPATGQAPTAAPAPVLTVKAGDAAPAFSLPGSDGKTHSLAEFAGKEAVVLAWYPKAFTGG
jgi:hypothetical protein